MRYFTLLLLSFALFFNAQAQILDVEFGDNGISILDKYDDPGFQVFSLLDGNGQLLLAGIPSPSFMNSKVFIARLNIDGTPDATFGEEGYSEYDLGEGFVSLTDFIQLDNGNLIVAGTSFQDGWLIMFNAEGDLVTSFGDNGFFDTQISADVNRVLITQANDKIFALHKGRIGGSAHLATSYYNMDGTYDMNYGTNGSIIYQDLQFDALEDVSWDYGSDGVFNGVYFSGYRPNGEDVAFIGNVSADGVLNSEFGDGGYYRLSGANFLHHIALANDGNLLLSARNGDNYVIQKLDDQGELVSEFGVGGSFTNTWSLPINSVEKIIPMADNGFLHGGTMDAVSESKPIFQKHNADGSIDEEVGEVVYDLQSVLTRDMLHADNGDIYMLGFTIGAMSDIDKLCIIKYKSDLNDVDNISNHRMKLSPNPSVNARWTLGGDDDINIVYAQLMDIAGRYIIDLVINKNEIYTQDKVDSGLYIISGLTAQGEIINTKVVISK